MKKNIIITFAVLFFNTLFAQTKFTIPVVVHVISPSTTPIVTAKEVQDAIKNLNLQFKGLYAKTNKSGIIAPYQNSISSFENIQFKLATLDVNNKPTTGINFIKNATWSNNASDNEATFKKTKTMGQNALHEFVYCCELERRESIRCSVFANRS